MLVKLKYNMYIVSNIINYYNMISYGSIGGGGDDPCFLACGGGGAPVFSMYGVYCVVYNGL